MGRRAHKADPAQRRQVEAMAAFGIPETDISRVIGADPKTLRKHYREELDFGETKANAQVAGFLFNSARSGNVTPQIFWLKTRARWRETPLELKHSGSIAGREIHEYSGRGVDGHHPLGSRRPRRDASPGDQAGRPAGRRQSALSFESAGPLNRA
jgi:hypothetical protein